jgi:hypothetical protein
MSRVDSSEVPPLCSLAVYDANLKRDKTYFHLQRHLSFMTVLELTLETRQCHCTSKWQLTQVHRNLCISTGKFISEKQTGSHHTSTVPQAIRTL